MSGSPAFSPAPSTPSNYSTNEYQPQQQSVGKGGGIPSSANTPPTPQYQAYVPQYPATTGRAVTFSDYGGNAGNSPYSLTRTVPGLGGSDSYGGGVTNSAVRNTFTDTTFSDDVPPPPTVISDPGGPSVFDTPGPVAPTNSTLSGQEFAENASIIGEATGNPNYNPTTDLIDSKYQVADATDPNYINVGSAAGLAQENLAMNTTGNAAGDYHSGNTLAPNIFGDGPSFGSPGASGTYGGSLVTGNGAVADSKLGSIVNTIANNSLAGTVLGTNLPTYSSADDQINDEVASYQAMVQSGAVPAFDPNDPSTFVSPASSSSSNDSSAAVDGFQGIYSGGGEDGVGNYGKVGDFFGGIGDSLGITNYSGENTPEVPSIDTPPSTYTPPSANPNQAAADFHASITSGSNAQEKAESAAQAVKNKTKADFFNEFGSSGKEAEQAWINDENARKNAAIAAAGSEQAWLNAGGNYNRGGRAQAGK